MPILHDSELSPSSWRYENQSLPLPPPPPLHCNIQTPQQPVNEPPGRVIFTRQLWQRTMRDGIQGDQRVLNRSHARDNPIVAAGFGQYIPSSVSSPSSSGLQRGRPSSPSPAGADSKTPLTPEESPRFSRSTRKRTAGIVEDEDKALERETGKYTSTSIDRREDSSDSGIHVCICQPDPKIPRPRNAFILYRQHHQAGVIAQNPGLSNPEISKIIGEQWQNQQPEVKNKWKALAEEEKVRHQQQYPLYRYQPKRTGRRNSIGSEGAEKPRCPKCGGKSTLTPSTPQFNTDSSNQSSSGLQTPGSAITPVSRTLPVLRDLSLQSSVTHRIDKDNAGTKMPSGHHPDEMDELGPLSPDLKRRRFNGEHPLQPTRIMPSRYVNALVGPPVQPGTPFPFGQAPPHPYPPGAPAHARRESLPGLRGMVSPPGPMAPPPRPGPGYQQHRLSQGHLPHDRSLTLPPLQTSGKGSAPPVLGTSGIGKSAEEQIMNMDFRSKVHVLRRVAPPVPVEKHSPRGPFVTIEGENFACVKELSIWLAETLRKEDDLQLSLVEGPKLSSEGDKEVLMAEYHSLAAEWLGKSKEIRQSLAMRTPSPTVFDVVGTIAASAPGKAVREIDDDYNDSDDGSSKVQQIVKAGPDDAIDPQRADSVNAEVMDVDNDSSKTSAPVVKDAMSSNTSSNSKPISLIANFSLYASNFFACKIPIDAHDPYAPNDHWQWTATQWRGIISPDLTIYVRDATAGDNAKQSVDILDEGSLFVVKRTKAEGKDALEIEPSTLRRLGFEVSEWVRAFGVSGEQEGGNPRAVTQVVNIGY